MNIKFRKIFGKFLGKSLLQMNNVKNEFCLHLLYELHWLWALCIAFRFPFTLQISIHSHPFAFIHIYMPFDYIRKVKVFSSTKRINWWTKVWYDIEGWRKEWGEVGTFSTCKNITNNFKCSNINILFQDKTCNWRKKKKKENS